MSDLLIKRAMPSAAALIDAVRAFHATWGDANTEDLDPLALWEDLGRIINPNGTTT